MIHFILYKNNEWVWLDKLKLKNIKFIKRKNIREVVGKKIQI